jgi:hypothetical protein
LRIWLIVVFRSFGGLKVQYQNDTWIIPGGEMLSMLMELSLLFYAVSRLNYGF